MSEKGANKEQIKQYMLKLIDSSDRAYISKAIESFDISRSSAYNYVNQMCKDGIIKKASDKATQYELCTTEYSFKYENNGYLGEDRIFNKDISPLLTYHAPNVISAWRYAFTEMMNNAIEHSRAEHICVKVSIDALKTKIQIIDDGIGIFKNIQDYMLTEKNRHLELDECVSLLFSGKFTTAKELHSGEGIFFTSHLMDEFLICSDNMFFSRDSFSDTKKSMPQAGGTTVIMSLHNFSKKTTREVFDRFSNVEDGFIRTHIPIAHIFAGGSPISRSEARRLGELITGFREIILDFTNVEEVGQAFSHELFVVWQARNRDVVLTVQNASATVETMIKRVINTSKNMNGF